MQAGRRFDDPSTPRGQLLPRLSYKLSSFGPGPQVRSTCPYLDFLGARSHTCRMLGALAACFAVLLAPIVAGAPTNATVVYNATDCQHDEGADIYDQRQNGTENYRIHVNGVVVLVAPAETVLQAAQLSGLNMGSEGDVDAPPATKPKPKPPVEPESGAPQETAHHVQHPHPKEPKEKNNLKLLNLLHMFRTIRHEAEPAEHFHQ